MKSYSIYIVAIILLIITGCKEENNLYPYGEDMEKGAPGQVSDIIVENIPGGAIITYQLPENSDIMYVKALYKVGNNTPMESRSSKYSNTLTVRGFGDTLVHEVKLYCVDRMEDAGVSATTTIKPLTPPIVSVFENLKMDATFGGIFVDFVNTNKANVAIHIMTEDSLDQVYEPYVHYTESESGRFFVRGFRAEERNFGIYVTDRWGNKSDTLYSLLAPFQESRLDKRLFNPYILPGDLVCNAWGGNLVYAWNDDFTPALFVHSPGGAVYPVWFTFDMGVVAKLSRYKFYHLFMNQHAYQRGNLKKWEIWGRTDRPPSDGSWGGWIKLMDCNSYKPSGLPTGQITAEDWEYLKSGEDFEFSSDVPSVRYIRFKIVETWGNMDFIHFTEFTFWGNAIN